MTNYQRNLGVYNLLLFLALIIAFFTVLPGLLTLASNLLYLAIFVVLIPLPMLLGGIEAIRTLAGNKWNFIELGWWKGLLVIVSLLNLLLVLFIVTLFIISLF